MLYQKNWEAVKKCFVRWWLGQPLDRPLISLVAEKSGQPGESQLPPPVSPEDKHLNVQRRVAAYREYCSSHSFLLDSFPYLDLDLGAVSLALYMGAEPYFSWDTIWGKPCVESLEDDSSFVFNPANKWWQTHLRMLQEARTAANGEFPIALPDICENLDVLSLMYGTEKTCYALIEDEALLKRRLEQLDDALFRCHEAMFHIVRMDEGSCYTWFHLWGPKRSMKIQSDFSALISSADFQKYVMPTLEKETERFDYTLYHLDGPDSIKHLRHVMSLEKLNAVQWIPGAGQPGNGDEKWYPLYEEVRRGGKSLDLPLDREPVDISIRKVDKMVSRFGIDGMFFLFPDLNQEDAEKVLDAVEKYWTRK